MSELEIYMQYTRSKKGEVVDDFWFKIRLQILLKKSMTK